MTAHCFGEQSVAELVAAGIDCIEHGTGVTDEVIDEMARRGTALVPTRVQLDNFPAYAEQAGAKFPTYAAHMRDLHARCDQVLGARRTRRVSRSTRAPTPGCAAARPDRREVLALHEQVGLSGAATHWPRRPGRPAGLAGPPGPRGGRAGGPRASTTTTRAPTCARWPTPPAVALWRPPVVG